MLVLVTGGNGFIGSALVDHLRICGHDVRCLVRETSDLSLLDTHGVELVYGDLSDSDGLVAAVRAVDRVYHLAGVTRANTTAAFYAANLGGTLNLLSAVAESGRDLDRLVFISSLAAAGPGPADGMIDEAQPPAPISDYGGSKLEAEEAVRSYHNTIPATIIRPPGVYGPRERDIFIYFKLIKHHLMPVIGGADRTFSLIHVQDLVEGIELAASSPAAIGETFFLCNQRAYGHQELGRTIQRVLDTWCLKLPVPEWAVDLVTGLSAVTSRVMGNASILNRDKAVELKARNWACSVEKARQRLGFRARLSLEEGVRETVAWYRSAGWL